MTDQLKDPTEDTRAGQTHGHGTRAASHRALTVNGGRRLHFTDGYNKTEIDNKISAILIGLEHGVAVQAIQNAPPATPVADEVFIVGKAPTGTWAGHANALALWSGSAWGFTSPQAKEAHLVEDQTAVYSWNGTAWVKVATGTTTAAAAASLSMLGDIKESILTETQFKTELGPVESVKWVLADGRNVAGSDYQTLTGSATVPDLRGAFLRMAGQNNNASWNGGTLGGWQEDSTARPKVAFTGGTSDPGNHTHGYNDPLTDNTAAGGNRGVSGAGAGTDEAFLHPKRNIASGANGGHTHTVTINGGGDTETRPKNYGVNMFIKVYR